MKTWLVRSMLLALALVVHTATVQARQLWMETDGYTRFFSSTVVEDIEAKNYEASSAINTANNDIAVKIPIKKFNFPNSLMQEHFNENYMESNTYPNATFKGKVSGVSDWKKNGEYTATATGQLTMHGQTKEVTINGTIYIENDKITLKSSFEVMLVDYKIEIPTIMFAKIAEKIQVDVEYTYQKYNAGK